MIEFSKSSVLSKFEGTSMLSVKLQQGSISHTVHKHLFVVSDNRLQGLVHSTLSVEERVEFSTVPSTESGVSTVPSIENGVSTVPSTCVVSVHYFFTTSSLVIEVSYSTI